ncbi:MULTISPECIES: TetR/AcrR family transcriptional regulator [Burkholderiaceae]|uniref:TetR/AcrR family transcriptional regulator n=1 Tax=Burkholderiaceae TaxID=119060 RepID=UPI001640D593|nr:MULTISPECIES: TetR/AcrR family transcriptional regulator [Burkholderiaceae]
MPKPSKAEVKNDIIDNAAGLFAKHGFEHTSVQQIADAVRCSKTGLLYHFPSKQALYDAAIKTTHGHALALLASVKHIAPGVERDRAVIEGSLQFHYDWPGVSSFGNWLVASCEHADPQLIEIGLILYESLDIDVKLPNLERVVRVTSAFTGLGTTALQAVRANVTREWRPFIIAAAMDALGHKDKKVRETSLQKASAKR